MTSTARSGAYDRRKLMEGAAFEDSVIEIVRLKYKDRGFKVLPRRGVIERTFGWMTRWLVHDYEQRIDASQAIVNVTLEGLLLKISLPRLVIQVRC